MTRMCAAAAALIVTLLAAGGCTSGSSSSASASKSAAQPGAHSTVTTTAKAGGNRTLTGAERHFGASVGSIPGAVYKSDVVVIGGGAKSVAGALDNGLVWTIKGSAPGANHLTVGKIMVATSLATGRVAKVQHIGGNVQVVLTPVGLTDIFQELHVDSSAPVSLSDPLTYRYENSPVASSSTDSGQDATPPSTTPTALPTAPAIPRFRADAPRANAPASVPSVPSAVPKFPLPEPDHSIKPIHQGNFDLTPFCCYPQQGVRISYHEPTGRMAATVGLVMGSTPLVDFHIDIDSGGLQEVVFELHGPKAIEFQFDAATKDVSGNYRSPTLELPLSFTFPVGGVPFTVTLTQTVRASIQLAGQAAFSTKGEYAISGALGFAYRNKEFGASRPSFTSKLSALENAASLSVGINALSISYGAHLSIGIGIPGFNGGVNFGLDGTLAIGKDGSPPQTSVTAGCATAAVSVTVTYGVGYTIPKFIANAVNAFLKLINVAPIANTAGPKWGPYALWNPAPGRRCLQR